MSTKSIDEKFDMSSREMSEIDSATRFAPIMSIDGDKFWPNLPGYFMAYYHEFDLKREDLELLFQISCWDFSKAGYNTATQKPTFEELASRLLSDATASNKIKMVKRALRRMERAGYLIVKGEVFDFRPLLKMCHQRALEDGWLNVDVGTNKFPDRTNKFHSGTNKFPEQPETPHEQTVPTVPEYKDIQKEKTKESPPVPKEPENTDDRYLLEQDIEWRLKTLRNQVMSVKEPDERRNFKGYTKHDFYHAIERVFAFGCAVEGKKFGGYGLGTLCKWFHNEALGRSGKPASLLDLLDFMAWYTTETPGYHMPRERSRFVHWWNKWKQANPTVEAILAEFDKAVA